METQKTERIHALDSLRAIMMLLGLVLHSAITYGTFDFGNAWTLKDPETTHLSNDILVFFIHSFRMQTFFLVAGFFGAMLFYERKPLKMLKNRIARIVFPFIVFVILLWPFIVFTFGYTKLLFAESNDPLTDALAPFSSLEIFIPQRTFHLWFLYYLGIITFVSVGLGLLFKKLPRLSSYVAKIVNWIFQKPFLRILIFASITVIVYFIMGTSQVATSTSFIPDFNTFIYYFLFYMVGWILFKSKHLLGTFKKFDWATTLVGCFLFTCVILMDAFLGFELKIILKSIMVWLFVFGITGLFIRYESKHSSRMRYVSDASYWVYLIHLVFTAILPSFIVDWPIPSTLKFLIVLVSTGVICFASYHYLVRGTFIGKFLNGRKYTRRLADIKQPEDSTILKPVLDK